MTKNTKNLSFIKLSNTCNDSDFQKDVISGLDQNMKSLHCKYLYDERGSELFEEITELEEYYLTRCELQILKKYATEIAFQTFGKLHSDQHIFIEFGSGSSKKTKVLLDCFLKLNKHLLYIPIDISEEFLKQSAEILHKNYENYSNFSIKACCGSYEDGINFVNANFNDRPKVISFLGSSIGNFTKKEAIEFIKNIQKLCPGSKILIGFDLKPIEGKKTKSDIEMAYDDKKGITRQFVLNILKRINRELDGNFDISKFGYFSFYNEKEGRIEIYIRSLIDQRVYIESAKKEIYFKKGELIHTEYSYKYSLIDIDHLAHCADMKIEKIWIDDSGRFSLALFAPDDTTIQEKIKISKNILKSGWEYIDFIFGLLSLDAFLQKPIELRHPFIFYLGHSPAFLFNQIRKSILNEEQSINKEFDNMFERGIDPIVDNPSICHEHSIVPESNDGWPSIEKILKYRDAIRDWVLKKIPEILLEKEKLMAQKGRIFYEIAEHDYMHAETLMYMFLNLDKSFKKIPDHKVLNYVIGPSPQASLKGKMIEIPKGKVQLGVNFNEIDFGWDNEFPKQELHIPSFKVSALPITNGEFLEFVKSKNYENEKFWEKDDWKWKKSINLKHPHIWKFENNQWFYRTVFHDIPLDDVLDWPVYVSHAEAQAYCNWKGKRLLTEAEYHRTCYGSSTTKYPWGNEIIPGVHANFHFWSWAPCPVGYFEKGKSKFGIYDLIGNGWEWTSTKFKGFPGFVDYMESYKGYSKDFFDEHHYVMLGASWATHKDLIRKSFRNWFQKHYLYMFAKFRCAE